MQGIKPRKTLAPLLDGLKQRPAVALLGPRQVGKTTLAHVVSEQVPSLYLDLELPDDLQKLANPVPFLTQNADKLIILDEVQRVPDLFQVLRGVIDANRRRGKKAGQFLLLGSASRELLQQTSESLAGRIRYIEMGGFNALEVADIAPLHQHWLRGGFPNSYLADDDEQAMAWLEDFIRTYIERDLAQFNRRVSALQMRRLWTMLAHGQGEVANFNKLSAALGMDSKTVRFYVEVLCDLMLVRQLPPYSANVKKRLVKQPRYYIRDSGALHRLLGIGDSNALHGHPVLGKSWEGFVIDNVLSALPSGTQCYFYRTSAGAEIDLLIETPDHQLWAVEIKYGTASNAKKTFYRTSEEIGAGRRFVIYSGDTCFSLKGQIEVMPLPHFLTMLTETL